MKLSEILNGLDYEFLQGQDIEISEVTCNTNNVSKDSLFLCIVGFVKDGHSFANAVVENGATALLVEKDVQVDSNVTVVKVGNTRKAMAVVAANFYKNAHKKLRIIGVTGTSGKTSTTYMLADILKTAGLKVGIIGSVANVIGDRIVHAERTTPESLELHHLFSQMVEEGVTDVVMEVSSHSIELMRVDGIRFEVGIFTNLTQDHLDFHKTMEEYLAAKAKLFRVCKYGIFNADDMWAPRIISQASCDIFRFGMETREADLYARNIELSNNGVSFSVNISGRDVVLHVPIAAIFAINNSLGVIGAALKLGIDIDTCAASLKEFKGVAGRATTVPNNRNISIIVDFAHKPDALSNILRSVKANLKGKLITVFGCGGDRDTKKRPLMGQIAGEISDIVVLTSDNPRSEEPEKILSDIEVGITNTKCEYIKLVDRREAINYALGKAEENDAIVIAGKGDEDYQIFKDRTIHFDDVEVVNELLSVRR